jgi:hypothetical protein
MDLKIAKSVFSNLFFLSYFWAELEFELRTALARQVLYHISHASSPF